MTRTERLRNIALSVRFKERMPVITMDPPAFLSTAIHISTEATFIEFSYNSPLCDLNQIMRDKQFCMFNVIFKEAA